MEVAICVSSKISGDIWLVVSDLCSACLMRPMISCFCETYPPLVFCDPCFACLARPAAGVLSFTFLVKPRSGCLEESSRFLCGVLSACPGSLSCLGFLVRFMSVFL